MPNNTSKIITVLNILKNLNKIKFIKIVYNKVLFKVSQIFQKNSKKWAKEVSIGSTTELLNIIDKRYFKELKEEIKTLEQQIENILPKVPKILRLGSADCILLYFYVRKFRPKTILETGVSIGHSSSYILKGISKNSYGNLFSSDFKFLGVKNSEQYIGFLPKELNYHKNWNLLIDGDEYNIPRILKKLGSEKINLFHYDSDKSYRGKQKTLNLISNNTDNNTTYIFDDIQDDFFFYDFVKKNKFKYIVIKAEYRDKFVGIAGNFLKKFDNVC